MKQTMTLLRKELATYFNSPIAYIVVIFFLVFTSVWFFYIQQFVAQDVASLRNYFAIFPIVFIILLPAVTMRSWAEENKIGTVELLLTLPFREGQTVAGKFLGAFSLLVLTLVLTIPVLLTIAPLGDFEAGQIVGQYIGVLALGAAGLAIGLFVSSLSKNQITAFILSAVVLLFLTLINQVNFLMELPEWLGTVFNYLSLDYHFSSFEKGLIDTRDLVFYVALAAFFLYLNTKVLVFRKWR